MVYGQQNYYKRKYVQRRAICASCGSDVYLDSYNTTRCFHLSRIPLLPLSQHRVFDHCPACNASTEGPLRTWHQLRERDLEPALIELRRRGADPAVCRYALTLSTRLDSPSEFEEVAAAILHYHFQDPALLAELGASYHHFGRTAEGNDAFRRSLAIRDDLNVRRYLAFYESPLPHSPAPVPAPAPQLCLLAAFPLLLLGVLLLLGKATFFGAPHHLQLVNGLDRPYEILFNGERIELEPMSRLRLDAPGRKIQISPVSGGEPIDSFEETLRAPLFNRGASERVVVLNPDRAALLLWERAVYQPPGSSAEKDRAAARRFHTGHPLYVFEDIDHPFEKLPAELEKTPRSGSAIRHGLRQVTRFDPGANANLIFENGQRDTAIEYMRHGLRHHPENEAFLMLLAGFWSPGESIAFLETRLAERPVLVEWHRYYQELTARHQPEKDLLTAYRRLHLAEPQNRDLAYLLGRLIDDPDEATAVLQQAARPPQASPHALHALAFAAMNHGKFNDALSYERQALELLPGKRRFHALEEEMLLATGNFNELIKRRRNTFALDETDRGAALALTSLLALAGENTEARSIADRHLIRAATSTPTGKIDRESAALFDAAIAEGTRDFKSFAAAANQVGFGEWPWYSAIANRDLVRVIALLRERPAPNWRDHLLIYALASAEEVETIANEHLSSAVELLRSAGPRERPVAAWFESGALAPSLEEIYRLRQWPGDTRVLLTALGTRFPRMQSVYYTAARRMNYDPAFPGLVLQDLIDGSSDQVSTGR